MCFLSQNQWEFPRLKTHRRPSLRIDHRSLQDGFYIDEPACKAKAAETLKTLDGGGYVYTPENSHFGTQKKRRFGSDESPFQAGMDFEVPAVNFQGWSHKQYYRLF